MDFVTIHFAFTYLGVRYSSRRWYDLLANDQRAEAADFLASISPGNVLVLRFSSQPGILV